MAFCSSYADFNSLIREFICAAHPSALIRAIHRSAFNRSIPRRCKERRTGDRIACCILPLHSKKLSVPCNAPHQAVHFSFESAHYVHPAEGSFFPEFRSKHCPVESLPKPTPCVCQFAMGRIISSITNCEDECQKHLVISACIFSINLSTAASSPSFSPVCFSCSIRSKNPWRARSSSATLPSRVRGSVLHSETWVRTGKGQRMVCAQEQREAGASRELYLIEALAHSGETNVTCSA